MQNNKIGDFTHANKCIFLNWKGQEFAYPFFHDNYVFMLLLFYYNGCHVLGSELTGSKLSICFSRVSWVFNIIYNYWVYLDYLLYASFLIFFYIKSDLNMIFLINHDVQECVENVFGEMPYAFWIPSTWFCNIFSDLIDKSGALFSL